MSDSVLLTLPTTPGMRGIATLVLGGIGSRLHLPYERMDDLQLAALSALSASSGDTVTLEVTADEGSLVLGIGPLAEGSGADSGLRRVLERLVDSVEPSARDGREWITLRVES